MTALELARLYTVARDWRVIPVPHNSKNPGRNGWESVRILEPDLPRYFNGQPQNIGVLLGEPSGGLVDVDLDWKPGTRLADYFLPATDCEWGRPSARRSHRLYVCDPLPETRQFRDIGGAMLLEFRSTGAQTLAPGSTNPKGGGEVVSFDKEGVPLKIDGARLLEHVSRLAAAFLIAKHWPDEGARHDAANALAGGLLRAGWDLKDASDFVYACAVAAGDEEARARIKDVPATAKTLTRGRKATGWPKLAELIGEGVVERAREWLGIVGETPFSPFPLLGKEQMEKSRAFKLTRLGELLAEPVEDVAWLVEDMLPAGGSSLLGAKPKVGKSTLARN
jgi:hypothetical protein